ncbi:Hypothetical protein CAP_4576 [Chondromyces apiculatus DSM 436]|uniref:FHA domain-containing protein n=1 Tax=Chondromyces apiculatus DSM 436 TaxID=1192034 RepID=A0A017T5L3_9BACT|nr:Hypothetical protein CAP_4576 [Chondromyces apiculatus DSM 436]
MGYPPPPPPADAGSGGYPPVPRADFGPPPPATKPARCVQGHPIAPGGSFCMEGGHPIALDTDAYGPTHYSPQGGGFSPEPYAPPPQGGGFSPDPYGPPPQGGGFSPEPYAPPPQPPPPPPPPPLPGMNSAPPRQPLPSESSKERGALAGFLISFQDDPLGKHWVLYQGKNLVGRAETGQKVDIPVAHGTTSTHHATIDCDGGRMMLSDLGSTNGTFHNEEAIGFQGRRELRDGDRIRFGGFSVIVINVATRS